jgi:RNA polymerase sigma factor (sigma-70 family)
MQSCNFQSADTLFYSLYEEYQISVSEYAYRILGDREEARDISVDTFIDVWMKRQSFVSIGKMRSFVLICAKNACLNRLKLIRHREGKRQEVLDKYYHIGAAGIIEDYGAPRDTELIKAIKSLDLKYRECIWLFYFEKMTCAKIARKMKISERNVRLFLTKGKVLIKMALSLN